MLTTPVFNYSWPLFPYIWNEIKFHIAYDSDLEFVARTMQEVAEEELGEQMMSRVRTYRELLAKTPVDHLEVRERPPVFFRVEREHLARSDRALPRRAEAGGTGEDAAHRRSARAPQRRARPRKFPKSNLR